MVSFKAFGREPFEFELTNHSREFVVKRYWTVKRTAEQMESMYNKLVAQETGAKNESSPKANGQVNGATTKV